MNKKILCAAILSLLSIGAVAQFRINMGEDSPLRKLQIAEMAVTNLYVDSVNEDKLVEDGIRGMLEKLDPHSSYLTAKEVKEANEPLQGNFEGIGVQFNMAEDTLLVIQPVTNGPSEKVGIIAGDRIVKVNDTITSFRRILNGEGDNLPEAAFTYVGTFDDAIAKAKTLESK
jgi:carboxyl-terminal processing protease